MTEAVITQSEQTGKEVHAGSNVSNFKQPDPDFMKELLDSSEELDGIELDRSELNARSQAIFARLESKHALNRKAVKAARNYIKLDEDARENYDMSYRIMREALGSPLQGDLFEASAAATLKEWNEKKKQEDEEPKH